MNATLGSELVSVFPEVGLRGAVSSGHSLATMAGIDALRDGGNAVDAAVAAAYALMVVLPNACGVGGDASLLVSRLGSTDALVGGGHSRVAFEGMLGREGAVPATVPGAVAALDDALEQYGALARDRILQPAIKLAADGVPLSASLLRAVDRQRERLTRGAPSTVLLRPGLRAGQLLRFPELACTLNAIAQQGAQAFYAGPVAAAIEKAALSREGALSMRDLESHETLRAPALVASMRGATIFAAPPSSGAALAVVALNALHAESSRDPSDRTHAAIEAVRSATALPSGVGRSEPLGRLLGSTPQMVVRSRFPVRRGAAQQAQATMVTSSDLDGTVVSMVLSHHGEFGGATLVPDYGIFLNGQMIEFDREAAMVRKARPTPRPPHALSPVIVDEGERLYAVAAPEPDSQVQILSQVLDARLSRGLGLTAAVDLPRWRADENHVIVEAGFNPDVVADLERRGHRVAWERWLDSSFGAVAMAGIEVSDGSTFAIADLRREASAAVV